MKSFNHPAYKKFLRVLKSARLEKGLSQEAVAERLLRPQSFVSKVESGERRLDVLDFLQWSQAIDVDPLSLISTLAEDLTGKARAKTLSLKRRPLVE